MSATDDLRRMLDELGVKYMAKDRPMASHADWEAWQHRDRHQSNAAMRRETLWDKPTGQNNASDTYRAKATEVNGELSLEVTDINPEQALAATLLRDGFSSMSREHTQTIIELSDAYGKIDELQELVEDMLSCLEIQEAFDRPPTSKMCKAFTRRANKLGIEVDDE